MSNTRPSREETQDNSEFSLTKAVEDVSHHSYAQTEALKEKQKILNALQAALSDVEKKGKLAEQELRAKVREVLLLEGEMEDLERQIEVLHDRHLVISKENAQLQICISEEEECAHVALEGFNTYRGKMEAHRAAVLHATSQTGSHKELEEKQALVRQLRQEKEDLEQDLENPNGSTVKAAKKKMNALEEEISVKKKLVAERREQLQKEFGTHTQKRKDLEIQNRRYEAIVKRLHCQLSRAQAVHRQVSEDIYHMERQLAELKRQQESSQGSGQFAAGQHGDSESVGLQQ